MLAPPRIWIHTVRSEQPVRAQLRPTRQNIYLVLTVGIDAKSLAALGQTHWPWHNLEAAVVAAAAVAMVEEAWHRLVEAERVVWHRSAAGLPIPSEVLSPPADSRHSVVGAAVLAE